MSFIEPWSMPKQDRTLEKPELAGPVYEIAPYAPEDFAPSVDGYVPVSLEELAIDPDAGDDVFLTKAEMFPDSDFSEVSWDEPDDHILMWIEVFATEPWEEAANDDWDHPGVVTAVELTEHLEILHENVAGLNHFQDVREFSAWLSEAIDRLTELKREAQSPMHKLALKGVRERLKTQILSLEEEIEEFEREWGFRERIAEYEERVLNLYVSSVVAAQKRVAARRASHDGIGKFGPKPNPRSIKSSYEFEHYCQSWMLYLGAEDAEVSRATGDGGVDVISEKYVAQVKLYNAPIPVAQVRDLLGTAVDFNRKPLFFASMAYSKGSVEFADRNGIALFIVDSYKGEIHAANAAAEESLKHGLHG